MNEYAEGLTDDGRDDSGVELFAYVARLLKVMEAGPTPTLRYVFNDEQGRRCVMLLSRGQLRRLVELAQRHGVAEPTDLDPCYGNPVEQCTNPGHVKRGHEELFAAEADYWQKRHAALSQRVRSSIEALGGTAYIGDYDNSERPEPPVGTTFTNPSTGTVAWCRSDDGWHCSNDACWNCPADWAEVVQLGHIDALTRHLPGGDEA